MDKKIDMGFVKNKADAVLSFVKRQCRDRLSKEVSNIIYTCFVRLNVEFASSVWNPHSDTIRCLIECV